MGYRHLCPLCAPGAIAPPNRLQYIVKNWLVGPVVTEERIAEAKEFYVRDLLPRCPCRLGYFLSLASILRPHTWATAVHVWSRAH